MKKERKLELIAKLVYWSDGILRVGYNASSSGPGRIDNNDLVDIITLLSGGNTSRSELLKNKKNRNQ